MSVCKRKKAAERSFLLQLPEVSVKAAAGVKGQGSGVTPGGRLCVTGQEEAGRDNPFYCCFFRLVTVVATVFSD